MKKVAIFIIAVIPSVAIVKPGNWDKTGTLFHDRPVEAIVMGRNGPLYLVGHEFKAEVFERFPEATFLLPTAKIDEIVKAINANRSEDARVALKAEEIRGGHQLIEIRVENNFGYQWDRYDASDKDFNPLEQARYSIETLAAIVCLASILTAIAVTLLAKVKEWKRRATGTPS